MRAVIVCRFPIYREALVRLVDVHFEPGSGEGFGALAEALDGAGKASLDVMLVDAGPDDPDFGELKAAALAIQPAPLVLFAALSQAAVQLAFEAGVRGCIPKASPPELVAAALRLVLAGGLYFSDFGDAPARPKGDGPLRWRLSSRQLEVLRLIELGQTNKEIAKALGISVATVKLHVQAILNITGARNRTEAALRARGHFS